MAPTFLVVGSIGNTGRSVVETLSNLLKSSDTFSSYRILALTRSINSGAAQQLAKLPGVEVVEQNWVEITADWLRGHEVPNIFTPLYLSPAAEFIKKYRETGKQETLKLMASQDAPVGIVHPDDVGAFAAKLLLVQDVSVHNNANYVLNGPEDISGSQIVRMVEQHIGSKVEDVRYKDMTFIDHWAAETEQSKNVILSIKHAPETAWDGKCTAFPTSKEVLKLAAPKHTPADVLRSLLEG